MGGPSISILLNEVAKLLKYAKADSIWLRLGTCGGVGVAPGTVAISESSVNGALEPYLKATVLGKEIKRPAQFDSTLNADIKELAESLGYPVVLGKTMTADDFYEGQGRLDGAICDYTEADKFEFLNRAYEAGVRNIEMESLTFGAFTRHVGIRAATVCAVLLNRLQGDQVSSSPEQLRDIERRAGDTVLRFVAQEIKKTEDDMFDSGSLSDSDGQAHSNSDGKDGTNDSSDEVEPSKKPCSETVKIVTAKEDDIQKVSVDQTKIVPNHA